MKTEGTLLLSLALSAAMLLSGCGGQSAGSASEVGSASVSTSVSASGSGSGSVSGSDSSGSQSSSSQTPAQDPSAVTFTDALGREVTVSQPTRVAALIGSFADVWCLAGGEDTLVATASDAWLSFDMNLDGVSDLGGVKEPDLETLLASEPDFIIASSNTGADLELQPTLEQAGIPTAYFDIQNLEDYLQMLDICTRITGRTDLYTTNGLDVQKRAEAAIARQDGSHPRILCMRATGSSCKVYGSQDFLLGEMLDDMGCINVADSDDSLLQDLSLEAIMAADPDDIFVVLQGADASRAQETMDKVLFSNPVWETLRAVKEGHFYSLDHRLFNLKPNALWGESYEILADILYPQT